MDCVIMPLFDHGNTMPTWADLKVPTLEWYRVINKNMLENKLDSSKISRISFALENLRVLAATNLRYGH
jgi:hypothetical protein